MLIASIPRNVLLFTALALPALVAGCGDDGSGGAIDGGVIDPTAECTLANEDMPTPGNPLPLPGNPDDDHVAPSPPSIGADVPVTYFGPAPSDVNERLIGPVQLLKSGTVDIDAGTVTIPLYRGQLDEIVDGEPVSTPFWYVITDTDDENNAAANGLNFSAKLSYAMVAGGNGVRTGAFEADGSLTVDQGAVDFAPVRSVTPGAAPNFFPPAAFQPGSVGDAFYSPLVLIENAGGRVYNAPIISFGLDEASLDFCDGAVDYDLVHDKVVRFCPSEGTVTLALTAGFSFGRPVLYLSLDASVDAVATLEGATFAPGLADVPTGRDDSVFSAVERIFVFINGPMGNGNPQRQGLNSALSGEGSPLNILGGIPTIATDYSPLWDVNLGEWTEEAIDAGYRSRLFEEFAILGMVVRGHITGPGGAAYGSVGAIVNCPIVFRFL